MADKMKFEDYTIHEHRHRSAAWIAGRSASVRGGKAFSVERAKEWIEATPLREYLEKPQKLPDAARFDDEHCEWRKQIIAAANRDAKPQVISHGTAAKLINVYLKASLICGGHHEKAKHIHPPIDRLLLNALAEGSAAKEDKKFWREYAQKAWSKFETDDYQAVIDKLKTLPELKTKGLWAAEYYWQGYQNTPPKKSSKR